MSWQRGTVRCARAGGTVALRLQLAPGLLCIDLVFTCRVPRIIYSSFTVLRAAFSFIFK